MANKLLHCTHLVCLLSRLCVKGWRRSEANLIVSGTVFQRPSFNLLGPLFHTDHILCSVSGPPHRPPVCTWSLRDVVSRCECRDILRRVCLCSRRAQKSQRAKPCRRSRPSNVRIARVKGIQRDWLMDVLAARVPCGA